jgi:hypothetical protein
MIWQRLCRLGIRCTWTTRTDFASDHAVPSTAEKDNWVSSWIVGNPVRYAPERPTTGKVRVARDPFPIRELGL